jgi:hypothetical protein
MTEDSAGQVFPRLQFVVTAGDHAVYNRPILKYHQWLRHSPFALPLLCILVVGCHRRVTTALVLCR